MQLSINKNSFLSLIVFFLLLTLSTPISAAKKPFENLERQNDAVDAYIKSRMAEDKIPGLALAVIRDDKIIRAQGYGVASLELKTPVTAESVFEIGSITKAFTGTAVMLLVEDGKINLEDKLSKYLSGIPKRWMDVTVEQLLRHTSGIPNYSGGDYIKLFRNEHTAEEIIKIVSELGLEFKTGEKFDYSNTNYYLLGLIIEKASGKTYWEFLDERMFKPLKMKNTQGSDPKKIIPNRVEGYRMDAIRDEMVNVDAITASSGGGAGSLISTVSDLARWQMALADGRIIKKTSLDKMWSKGKLTTGKETSYGFGWSIDSVSGHPALWVSGYTASFSCILVRFPEDEISVIVFTNLYGPNVYGIAKGVANIYEPSIPVK
jgi:D-alanyl-D-alanine carboxypeptidase